jgi:hypothetical protein
VSYHEHNEQSRFRRVAAGLAGRQKHRPRFGCWNSPDRRSGLSAGAEGTPARHSSNFGARRVGAPAGLVNLTVSGFCRFDSHLHCGNHTIPRSSPSC